MAKKPKPVVMTPAYQQLRSSSTFRVNLVEDPFKCLNEYDRVAKYNKWDEVMCLVNIYFFLDGTVKQWYLHNEDKYLEGF